ncbi:hypothetical protein AYO50_02260 [Acidobacteria bacterium SCGC AG-212-P17]|nr:hypothetical protein AYO50_02260 [Acidobacteria bacterium SCGC AG-212-P17]
MKVLLTGCLLIAIGYWLTSHGVHVFTGRYRQPVFSYNAIAAGIVLILISVAPARLIIKMTALKKYRPYHHGSQVSAISAEGVARKASSERR